MSPNPEPTPSLPAVDVGRGEGAGELRNELRKRGIIHPLTLLQAASPAAITGAIRWYDEQPREGSGAIGPGLLANVIRDGGMPGYGVAPAIVPCPCTPELREQWELVIAHLERTVSEDDWVMRYAPWVPLIHPHAFDDALGWTLAAEAWALSWIGARRLRGLREAAGRPVALVTCSPDGAA